MGLQKRWNGHTSSNGNTLSYHVTKKVPYCADDFMKVVQKVENYEKFLPFCEKSTISPYKQRRQRKSQPTPSAPQLVAMGTLHIGYGHFTDRYTSRVTVTPEKREIIAENMDGNLFKEMRSKWTFIPLEPPDQNCEFSFNIDYTVDNRAKAEIAKRVFPSISELMVDSFLKEVKRQSGR